jgi:hypothetical protein
MISGIRERRGAQERDGVVGRWGIGVLALLVALAVSVDDAEGGAALPNSPDAGQTARAAWGSGCSGRRADRSPAGGLVVGGVRGGEVEGHSQEVGQGAARCGG